MKHKKALLLIHGAGLGSFIWDDLMPHLSVPALAIDFPNRNKADKANAGLSFQTYVESVLQQAASWDVEEWILVCHSIGGCVGLKVAENLGSNVSGFIGIGAAIPRDGGSFVTCLPIPQRWLMPVILKLGGTKPPQKAIENSLCTGLNAEQTKNVLDNFTPESLNLYLENCNAVNPPGFRWYIKLTDDKDFPINMQDKMAENLKAQLVKSMPGGHMPMFSHPGILAGIIHEILIDI